MPIENKLPIKTDEGTTMFFRTVINNNSVLTPLYATKQIIMSGYQHESSVAYMELSAAGTIPVDKDIILIRYQTPAIGDDISQPLPDITQVKAGTRIYIHNVSLRRETTITLVAANSSQSVAGASRETVSYQSYVELIANKEDSNWDQTVLITPSISEVIDPDNKVHIGYQKLKIQHPFTIDVDENVNDQLVVSSDYSLIVESPTGDSVGGIKKIEFPDAVITDLGSGDVRVTIPSTGSSSSGITFTTTDNNLQPTQYGGVGNSVVLRYPLQGYSDPNKQNNLILEVKPGVYADEPPAGFLSSLSRDEAIEGTEARRASSGSVVHSNIWLDDIMYRSGKVFMYPELSTKSWIVQEEDELDPNITGGTMHFCALRMSFLGQATSDCLISISLYDAQAGQYLMDGNGNPFIITKHYKETNPFGGLSLRGMFKAKGQKKIQVRVSTTSEEMIYVSSDNTFLCIQELTKEMKLNNAIDSYSLVTGHVPRLKSKYFGVEFQSLSWYIKEMISLSSQYTNVAVNAGSVAYELGSYWWCNAITNLIMSVDNTHMIIKDNGTDMCYFTFGTILSYEDTQDLKDNSATINAKIVLTDKSNAFNIVAAKWTNDEQITTKVVTGISNDTRQYEENWEEISSSFITEDPIAGDHTAILSFSIPEDARRVAIFIVPIAEQSPIELKLKDFTLSSDTPFTAYYIQDLLLGGKNPTVSPALLPTPFFTGKYKKWSIGNDGNAAYRFTINHTATPMPIGSTVDGTAKLKEVNEPNYKYESMRYILSDEAGLAEGSASFRVHVGENVPTGGDVIVSFYLAESSDGISYTEIPDSRISHTLKKSMVGYQIVQIPRFLFDLGIKQQIKLYATAIITGSPTTDDGAYIESDRGDEIMSSLLITLKE